MILRFLLRRVLAAIPVVIGVTLITFLLMHSTAGKFVPGLALNPSLTARDVQLLRSELGLDQPLYVQYLDWTGAAWIMQKVGIGGLLVGSHDITPGLLQGSFGHSMVDGTAVSGQIFARLPNTILLTLTAIVLGVLLSIPLGVLGALRRGTKLDHFFTFVSVAGVAIPQFWLGLMLILLFSVKFHDWGLPFLPSSGITTPFTGGDLLDRLAHLVLPAIVLSFVYLAIWSRYTRSSMLEVLSQDYVRTARAKGMSSRRVTYTHALRNAIIPLVTLVGLELPGLVSGALVVEAVFSWPGIGLLLYQRALAYDYTTVLGIVTFAAVLVVLGNLVADLLYAAADPRIRLA
ncbi:MAG: diguanylate cyclase [Candidatus Nephthysia bennettiae]|uniref:ABC transporter permease n=1 Tax=Candidatus Nephthysia bennettiae TaxID=3127016 RepID=A0A934K4G1_9BACT|nr:ABC transporter permease [Candidatus Dormibacteraeota bacterium]MBJ7614186.1 ABC transporter permease [Candidatus Dormibacteraeota bacterium]PZR99991.1 MAG: diguanylate cyclase [Candidatus Dormibacteraeota bacterium]